MTATLRFIDSSDPAWDATLFRARHDVYHTAEYHRLWEHMGAAYLAVYGDEDRYLAWPFLLCRLDDPMSPGNDYDLFDVTSVYGYPGPVAKNCKPGEGFAVEALTAILQEWRKMGAISEFTRFNPLLENQQWTEGAFGSPEVRQIGDTISIDLSEPAEHVFKGYRRYIRKQILEARNNGLASYTDFEWTHLSDFVHLLHATMDRNDAAPEYYLSAEFFETLRRYFPQKLFLRVVQCDSQVECAGVFLEFDKAMHALYIGSSETGAARNAPKLLLDDTQRWARERGLQLLHLGGGRGARNDDSLFFFKSGFSRTRHPFWIGSWILDREKYSQLCDRHTARALRAGMELDADFFPAYRSPILPAVKTLQPNLTDGSSS